MRTRWISLIFLLSLGLVSCGPSTVEQDQAPMEPQAPADTDKVSSVTSDTTATTAAGVTTDEWKTYDNTQAGYSAKYPADWAVNESLGVNGELITAFMAPNDGQGIVVSVLNRDAAVEEIPDMPNTRCEQVTISGLSGRRCFDTLTFNFSTTLIDQGKVYTIAGFGKHLDENIYQLFSERFTVTP